MRRADRLFQLIHLLRTRRFATGAQLAETLGVSTRTVYRDVRDLCSSGVPIRGEAGVGYRLDSGYELPPLTFNTNELEALALGMRVVEAWAGSELASAARQAMTKVEAVLPAALRGVLARSALFVPARADAESIANEMTLLRRAIDARQRIHLRYRRADGRATERTVCPVALYFWGRAWTLAAWCELRGGYRSFRPDRMEDVSLLESSFADGAISLDGYVAHLRELDEPMPDPLTRANGCA